MKQIASDGTVYELSGPTDAAVVVLVHGLGLHRGLWRDYVPELSRRYRVLNYDLLGHGESPPPVGEPDLDTFSQQLLYLLDELAIERCAIIGFSLGGMINRRFAIDHPERLRAMAILNSPHERGDEAQRLVEQRALDATAGGPGATLDATIARWFTPGFIDASPDYIETVRGWVLANDPESYAKCRKVLAFGVVELIRPEPPLRHPTLIMTCENDSGSTPAMSEAIGKEIDGAQVVIVPRLQHMGLVEEPALFLTPLVEFLDDLKA